jgi:hypothetical protein
MKKSNLIKQLHEEVNSVPVPDVLEKVKQKTPIIVANNVTKQKTHNAFSFRLVASFMAFVMIAVSLYATIGAFLPENQTYTTLSIDINPSLELVLDENETIVETSTLNDDAQILLQTLNLVGIHIDTALETLLNRSIEQGYLKTNSENAILVSVKNKQSEKIQQLEQHLNNKMKNYLNGRSINNTILFEQYSEQVQQELEQKKNEFENQMNITPAKYQYIKRIIARIPSFAGHENALAQRSIVELYHLLNDMSGSDDLQNLINQILQDILNNGNGIGSGNGLGARN